MPPWRSRSHLMTTANDWVRGSGFGYHARRYHARWGPILALFLWGLALAGVGTATAEVRRPLLVYYGDETSAQAAQSENYAALFEVLRNSDSPRAAKVAKSIATDAEKFPLLVQRDIDALKVQARRLGIDLAIFTNALALEAEYQLFRAQAGVTETHRLPDIPPTSSTILSTSPLSRPEYLSAALLSVAALSPANSLDIVLITNGHGSRDMALIPRVNADLSQAGAALAMREMLESNDNGTPPAWAQPEGTSKLAFWQVLENVTAAHGVRFPLVFREACFSGIRSFTELFAVPGSVGFIAHSATGSLDRVESGLRAITRDCKSRLRLDRVLVGKSRTRRDPRRYVGHGVVRRAVRVVLRNIPIVVFFIPIALWISWYGFGRRRFRHKVALSWAKSR